MPETFDFVYSTSILQSSLDSGIITSSTSGPLFAKIVFKWVLTETLTKKKEVIIFVLIEDEFCKLHKRLHCKKNKQLLLHY